MIHGLKNTKNEQKRDAILSLKRKRLKQIDIGTNTGIQKQLITQLNILLSAVNDTPKKGLFAKPQS